MIKIHMLVHFSGYLVSMWVGAEAFVVVDALTWSPITTGDNSRIHKCLNTLHFIYKP